MFASIFNDEERRLIAFTRVLAVSLLGCLAFSWKLWISRPFYPAVPVFEWIGPFPRPWDLAFLGLLAGLLVGMVFRPRLKRLQFLVAAAFGVLFLQDQSRMWPSFYQFWFLLLILLSYGPTCEKNDAARILAGSRFVFAAVYFWCGVQKLTPHFFYEEFPWFVEPILDLLPLDVPGVPIVGMLAAGLEILIGIGLLTNRFRTIALVEALLMHGLIFFCIGPLRDDWNNSSWIWNLTVAIGVVVVFYKAPAFSWSTMFDAPRAYCTAQALAVLCIGVLPVLNNVNRWDSALSFNVYTGNVDYAEIHLAPDAVDSLPSEIAKFVTVEKSQAILSLNAWALSEFQANPYPETRIFLAIFRKTCSYLPLESAQLLVREKAGWHGPKRIDRYDCPAERARDR